MAEDIDATDRALLEELISDPRVSFAELGRRVSLSAPAVADRVNRLEARGVLRFRAEIDPAAVGLPLSAWVRIRPSPGQLPKIAEVAAESPQVVSCDRISGEDCFLLQLHVAGMQELEEALDRFLNFGQTTSSFVVASPVPRRSLPARAP